MTVPLRNHYRGRADATALERALQGEPVRLNGLEQLIAVEALTLQGLSARETAGRIRRTQRTVVRIRNRVRGYG